MSMNFQGPAKFWLNKVATAAATTSSPSARPEVAHQVIRRVTAPTTATASDHREAHWISDINFCSIYDLDFTRKSTLFSKR